MYYYNETWQCVLKNLEVCFLTQAGTCCRKWDAFDIQLIDLIVYFVQ